MKPEIEFKQEEFFWDLNSREQVNGLLSGSGLLENERDFEIEREKYGLNHSREISLLKSKKPKTREDVLNILTLLSNFVFIAAMLEFFSSDFLIVHDIGYTSMMALVLLFVAWCIWGDLNVIDKFIQKKMILRKKRKQLR